jgi:hypothetical protein
MNSWAILAQPQPGLEMLIQGPSSAVEQVDQLDASALIWEFSSRHHF